MSSKTTTTRPPDTEQRPRVSLADRIALRVGMALIIWGRRTRRTPRTREPVDHRRFLAEQRALAERQDVIAAVSHHLNRWR